MNEIDALVTLREDLREAIAEGRALLKDLRAERRAAQELVASIEARVDEEIGEEIKKGLGKFGESIRCSLEEAQAKILTRFRDLEEVLLGTDKRAKAAGLPGLPAFVSQWSTFVDTLANNKQPVPPLVPPPGLPPRR